MVSVVNMCKNFSTSKKITKTKITYWIEYKRKKFILTDKNADGVYIFAMHYA